MKNLIAAAACAAVATIACASTANAASTRMVGDGTFVVGVDIQPGTYTTTGPFDKYMGCYWERLRGYSGSIKDVIANDYTHSKKVIVEIKSSDKAFKTEDCGTWIQTATAPVPVRPSTGSSGSG